jgi:hypothetical protein
MTEYHPGMPVGENVAGLFMDARTVRRLKAGMIGVPLRIVVALLVVLLPAAIAAQTFSGGYSFSLPAQDSSTQKFLPAFPVTPIGASAFVGIDTDGHFSMGGSPIRFFGVNFAADAAFPAPGKTSFVASRLRKMGFNLVRLHHLDNPWAASLFSGQTTTRQLNATMLNRLEFLIFCLKANGVRVNMNLHVSRTFTAADGVAGADSLPEMGKGVTYVDPHLIALQKEYAAQLLTHVNPFTGLPLVDDPVMAMVELTNENSLYRFWRDGLLVPFSAGGGLMVRHVALLDSLWNAFLAQKYGSTAALAAAWNVGATPADSTNLLRDGSFENSPASGAWTIEQHSPAAAVVSFDSTAAVDGKRSALLEVMAADGTDWHLQWKQVGLRVIKDSVYQLRFSAKADLPGLISVSMQKESSPWTSYGWAQVNLSTSWQEFIVRFRAPETNLYDTRVSFGVGAHSGAIWIDRVHLFLDGRGGLEPAENLEAATVRRTTFQECADVTPARARDITRFYVALQDSFFQTMRSYLVNTLHVRVPVVGTSLNAGLPDLASQSTMDFMDTHAYWDHPSFPGIPWSSTNWLITNQPMVQSTNGGTFGTLLTVAPMTGKPLTVSEYMHPFPNRYQTEALPFLTSYALFHGADGVMLFDYNYSSDDWESDKIASYFNINRNSALMSLVPSSALAYRQGWVAPSADPQEIAFSAQNVDETPLHDDGYWSGPTLVHPTQGLVHAVRTSTYVASTPTDLAALQQPVTPPFVSDTGELVWDPAGSFRVGAPRFNVLAGFFSNSLGRKAGDMILTGSSRAAFGVLQWVSLTGDRLSESRLSHLSVSTRVQNTGMVWDGTTTIHDQWGAAPTTMEPAGIVVRLHIRADSIHVYPLATDGSILNAGWKLLPADTNTFAVALDQTVFPTPWFGIEAFGGGIQTVEGGSEGLVPLVDELFPNSPNPFNPSTTIGYRLRARGWVKVEVCTILGEAVDVLADGWQEQGEHSLVWSAGSRASGVYFARIRVGSESGGTRFYRTAKMVLIR